MTKRLWIVTIVMFLAVLLVSCGPMPNTGVYVGDVVSWETKSLPGTSKQHSETYLVIYFADGAQITSSAYLSSGFSYSMTTGCSVVKLRTYGVTSEKVSQEQCMEGTHELTGDGY